MTKQKSDLQKIVKNIESSISSIQFYLLHPDLTIAPRPQLENLN